MTLQETERGQGCCGQGARPARSLVLAPRSRRTQDILPARGPGTGEALSSRGSRMKNGSDDLQG